MGLCLITMILLDVILSLLARFPLFGAFYRYTTFGVYSLAYDPLITANEVLFVLAIALGSTTAFSLATWAFYRVDKIK
mgnify:CR=1 FL=1